MDNIKNLMGKNGPFQLKGRGPNRLGFSIPLCALLGLFVFATACSKSNPTNPPLSLQMSKKESPLPKNISPKPLQVSQSGATASSTPKISNSQRPAFFSNPSSPSWPLAPNVSPAEADRRTEAIQSTGNVLSDNSGGSQNTAIPTPMVATNNLSGTTDNASNPFKEGLLPKISNPLVSSSTLKSNGSGENSGSSSSFIPSFSSSSPSFTTASNGTSQSTSNSISTSTIPAITSTPAVLPPQTSTFSYTPPPLIVSGDITTTSTGGTTSTVTGGGTTNLSLGGSGTSTDNTVAGTPPPPAPPPPGSSNSVTGTNRLAAIAGGALPQIVAANTPGIMASGSDDIGVKDGRGKIDRVLYGLPGSECNQLLAKQDVYSSDLVVEKDLPILSPSPKGFVEFELLVQQKRSAGPSGHMTAWMDMFKGWYFRAVFQPDVNTNSSYEYWDTLITGEKDGCNADFNRLPLDTNGDLYIYLAKKVSRPHEERDSLASLTDDEYREFQNRHLNLGIFKVQLPPAILERPTSSAGVRQYTP